MGNKKKSCTDFDLTSDAGRKGLSSLRNRGADRLVKAVKNYQGRTKHKVIFQYDLTVADKSFLIDFIYIYHIYQIFLFLLIYFY